MIDAPAALDVLESELRASGIVTRVLERWSGGRVHAEVAAGPAIEASAETRARLAVGQDVALGFRRVRLMRGCTVLSHADNWFVPDRLTGGMRAALARTDTPFGVAIAPLGPHRRTLAHERLIGDPMLRIRALVVAPDGTPLAEVAEDYARCLISG